MNPLLLLVPIGLFVGWLLTRGDTGGAPMMLGKAAAGQATAEPTAGGSAPGMPDWRLTDTATGRLVAWAGVWWPVRWGASAPRASKGREFDDADGRTLFIDRDGDNWFWNKPGGGFG